MTLLETAVRQQTAYLGCPLIAYRTESPTHGLVVFTTWNEFAAEPEELAHVYAALGRLRDRGWALIRIERTEP